MADLVGIRGVSHEPPDPVKTLQHVLSSAGIRIFEMGPNALAEVIHNRAWIGRLDNDGNKFRSFEDFVVKPRLGGLGCEIEDLMAICRKRPDVEKLIQENIGPIAAWRRPMKQEQSNKVDNVNLNKGGNASTYALKRLKRDRPDLAERVINGELSANAAAIEAGFRKKLTAYEQIIRLIPKLSQAEREELARKLQAG